MRVQTKTDIRADREPCSTNSRNGQRDQTLDIVAADAGAEVRRQQVLLKTGALQNAILNSANFSSIASDDKGVIQLFNVGAERMLGYAAADVLNKITPADISVISDGLHARIGTSLSEHQSSFDGALESWDEPLLLLHSQTEFKGEL